MIVVASSGAITRRALHPLTALAARVAAIEPGTGQNVGLQSRFTELELLRGRFDELIERFDAALAREKRLTAQASHELRTPLTVARAEIESLEAEGEERGKRERALAAIDHLSHLAETLLWFARSQALIDLESAEVVNVARALEELKDFGVWTVGLAADAPTPYDRVDFTLPSAIVLGAEGEGLRRLVRGRCDSLASIPMSGHVGSVNVSVAAGVVLFEAVRQRRNAG